MGKDIVIRGVTRQGIETFSAPISGGGTAVYRDTSGADAVAGDLAAGKIAYSAAGQIIGTKQPPSGSISITENGSVDVTDYATALVNVQSGGGGPTAADAILLVTVLASSVVTMTKGADTRVPTMWVSAANPSWETALFVVEAADFDSMPWAVTATDGSLTYSKNIVIDGNKEYSLVLNRVPFEFQEVEYLTSTNSSTQHIDIGITPYQVHGGTFGYMVTSTSPAAWGYVWGAGTSGSTTNASGSLGLGCGSNSRGLNYGSTILNGGGYTSGIKYTGSFSCSNGAQSLTVNGSTVSSAGTQTPTNQRNIVIFGFLTNTSVQSYRFQGNIYYLTFTDENGDLLRDLVPCYRKADSVAGMWDRVSETFMSPTGGALTPGPDVN